MKPIFSVAALAAAMLAAPVFAQEQSGDHYEWQSRQIASSKGSTSSVPVWVKDKPAQMASCDCDMMRHPRA